MRHRLTLLVSALALAALPLLAGCQTAGGSGSVENRATGESNVGGLTGDIMNQSQDVR